MTISLKNGNRRTEREEIEPKGLTYKPRTYDIDRKYEWKLGVKAMRYCEVWW